MLGRFNPIGYGGQMPMPQLRTNVPNQGRRQAPRLPQDQRRPNAPPSRVFQLETSKKVQEALAAKVVGRKTSQQRTRRRALKGTI